MNIQINQLTKTYKGRKVLEIESLKLSEGKFYGIVGDNGAGKSTLLRLIAGIEKPSTGHILYDQIKWHKYFNKEITYMHQKPYMLDISVYENIAYPLKIRNISKNIIEQKVNKLMETLDLYRLRDQKATTLSGGEAQKVAFARAIIIEPRLLLMDEPTAHIDKKTIGLFESIIVEYRSKTQMTTLMITHNPDQSHHLFDEIICLNGGLIDQSYNMEFKYQLYKEKSKVNYEDNIIEFNRIKSH